MFCRFKATLKRSARRGLRHGAHLVFGDRAGGLGRDSEARGRHPVRAGLIAQAAKKLGIWLVIVCATDGRWRVSGRVLSRLPRKPAKLAPFIPALTLLPSFEGERRTARDYPQARHAAAFRISSASIAEVLVFLVGAERCTLEQDAREIYPCALAGNFSFHFSGRTRN